MPRFLTLKLLFLVVFSLSVLGCGGGTTGTDNGGSRAIVRGRIVTPSSEALANVTVTLEESGDSTRSDVEGNYAIETSLVAQQFTLRLERGSDDGTITIDSALADATTVEIDLVASEDLGSIEIVSLSISPADTPDSPIAGTPAPSGAGESPESLFIGTLLFLDDVPVSRATISLRETGQQDRTDALGHFRITTPFEGGRATLRVRIGEFVDAVTIPDLPAGPIVVRITLRISIRSSQGGLLNSPNFSPSGTVFVSSENVSIAARD